MFLVLVVHADFLSNGCPDVCELSSSTLNSFTRIFIESLSIVCVNVFVMISGWFGIHPSVKGFCCFVFQCLYFLIGIYAVMLLTGQVQFSAKGLAECLVLTESSWFIRAYIGLYILSPILNAFIEKSTKRQLEITLLSFYFFQTVYGWVGAAKFIVDGYSTFSFIGLYLLAHYLRFYGTYLYKWGGHIYMLSTVCCSVICVIAIKFPFRLNPIAYVNPFVVTGAVGLIVWCAQLKIRQSVIINFIAKSSFAVYLLHCNPNIVPLFKTCIHTVYLNFDGLTCIVVISAILALIFIISVLIDQPRKWLWLYLSVFLFGKRRILRNAKS